MALLILGNGFDLQCELGSSFKDYVKFLKEQINKPELIQEIMEDYKINNEIYFGLNSLFMKVTTFLNSESVKICFWDILLVELESFQHIKDWADVENIVAFLVKRLFNENGKGQKDKADTNNDVYGFSYWLFKNIMTIHSRMVISLEEQLNWLNMHLDRLESNFARFIKTRISQCLDYYSNADYLYTELVSEFRKENIDILNFNYTDPQYNDLKKVTGLSNIITRAHHLHGDFSKRVIIGIDLTTIDDLATNKEERRLLLPFSKTYKKIHYAIDEDYRISKDTKNIAFYGHSLNYQDYSYFQSIFDFLDIYNNDIDIYFYYTDFSDEQHKIISDRVIELIEKYGETLSNKNHGRNLLHKLLVESRLHIRKIDDLHEIIALS